MIRTLHEPSEESGGMHDSQEMFSALLDGELAADELDALLATMENDTSHAAAAAATARWSAVGRTMRGQLHGQANQDLSVSVRAALATEVGDAAANGKHKVTPLAAARRRRGSTRWMLPGAGVAVAASLVAALMVLSPVESISTRLPTWMSAASGDGAPLQTVHAEGAGAEVAVAAGEGTADRAEQLNTYYIEFAGYRSAQGLGGPLGFARYAAHNVPGASASGLASMQNADMRSIRSR